MRRVVWVRRVNNRTTFWVAFDNWQANNKNRRQEQEVLVLSRWTCQQLTATCHTNPLAPNHRLNRIHTAQNSKVQRVQLEPVMPSQPISSLTIAVRGLQASVCSLFCCRPLVCKLLQTTTDEAACWLIYSIAMFHLINIGSLSLLHCVTTRWIPRFRMPSVICVMRFLCVPFNFRFTQLCSMSLRVICI